MQRKVVTIKTKETDKDTRTKIMRLAKMITIAKSIKIKRIKKKCTKIRDTKKAISTKMSLK